MVNKFFAFSVFILLAVSIFSVGVFAEQENECPIGCQLINWLKEKFNPTTLLTGQTILTSEEQANCPLGMVAYWNFDEGLLFDDNFNDGNAVGWTTVSGAWVVEAGEYSQSNTAIGNTNTYVSVTQGSSQVYEWNITYKDSGQASGIHIMSDDGALTNRGNSYLIWDDKTVLMIYEIINDAFYSRAVVDLGWNAGETHSFKVEYNNGEINIYRDDFVTPKLSWTDTTPLTSGDYISLRTNNVHAHFDDIKVLPLIAEDAFGVNNGTINGATQVAGHVGDGALSFDGVNDWVNIGNILPSSYTKVAWVQLSGTGTNNNIISGDGGHAFWAPAPEGRLSGGHNNDWYAVTGGLLNIGQWYHVALTYNANTKVLTLYQDGVDVSSASGIPAPSENAVQIGAFGGGNLITGFIDEAAIYDRALNLSEIQEMYNGGVGKGYCESAESAEPAESACPNGMVAYWKGEGDTTDSFNGFDAANNGVTFVPGVPGIGGQAFSFNGGATNADVNMDSLKGSEAITISGWYYLPNEFVDMNAPFNLMTNGSNVDAASGFWFHIHESNDAIYWRLRDSTGQEMGNINLPIVRNQWYFVTFIISTNNFEMYINGSSVYQSSPTFSWSNLDDDTLLFIMGQGYGINYNNGAYAFNGLLDEVAIYDRALTLSEIQEMYNGGVGKGYCEAIPETCVDSDGDNYYAYDDFDCPIGDDCNDENAAINPGATDAVCDGVDDNCNDVADDEYVSTTCGLGQCVAESICVAGVESCTSGTPGLENTNALCSDGIDNDCDTFTDFPADTDSCIIGGGETQSLELCGVPADLNNDGSLDIFDLIIAQGISIFKDNTILGGRGCEAVEAQLN